MTFLFTLLLPVVITISLVPVLTELAIMFYLLDIPDERKVHCQPTPRIGGIAILLGALVPVIVWHRTADFVVPYLIAATVLAVFCIVDDFRGVAPLPKFLGQLIAALIVVFWGGIEIRSLGFLFPDAALLPSWVGIPLTLFVIVGVTNAINLSDGLDGLAGGISLLILAGIGYLAYLNGSFTIGMLALAICGALFGFLRYNTHPASIFMGDTGSQFLGFSAVTLALVLTQDSSTPLSPILPLILLGFPVLDTLTVMVDRIARGVSPFTSDKNHFHHNLMSFGFSHAEAVLIIYVIQTMLLLAAFFLRFYQEWFLVTAYLLFSILILMVFSYCRRTEFELKRPEFIEQRVTGRLKRLKIAGSVIRPTFRFFELGIPLILLTSCAIANDLPFYIAVAGLLLAALVLGVWRFRRQKLKMVLRSVLYLLIPFAIHFSDTTMTEFTAGPLTRLYNGAFGLLAVMIIVISKFSRRESGFKSSPMDFLIVILAIVAPNLSDRMMQEYHLGLQAAKIIMLYFSFEVLLAELRDDCRWVALSTVASLIVIAV